MALPTAAEIKGQIELLIPLNGPEAGGTNRALASGGSGRSYSMFLKLIQLLRYLKV